MSARAPVGGARVDSTIAAIRGLQLFAALLVALSQVARLMEPDWLDWIAPLDSAFLSQNLAVTVLLATEGFAVGTFLHEERSRGSVLSRAASYVGRIWILLALVCAVAVVVGRLGETAPVNTVTNQAIGHVLTFSWNSWIADHPLSARSDLLDLWYFSVAVQLLLLVTVLGVLLRRWPRLLGVLLLAGAGVSAAYRVYALDEHGWFATALSTYARADAFLLGAAAVLIVPRLSSGVGSALMGGSLLCMVGVVISSSFLNVDEIMTVQVPIAAVAATAYLTGARAPVDRRTLIAEFVTAKDTVTLARGWRDIVAWSGLVVITVQQHSLDQPAMAEITTSVAALAIVCVLSRGLLDRVLGALTSVVSGHRSDPQPVGRRRAEVGSAEPGPEDRGAGSQPAPHA